MSLQPYRYYRLDGIGRLHLAEWFDAENDEKAIEFVEQTHPDAICEIWLEKRLVAKTSPIRLQA